MTVPRTVTEYRIIGVREGGDRDGTRWDGGWTEFKPKPWDVNQLRKRNRDVIVQERTVTYSAPVKVVGL